MRRAEIKQLEYLVNHPLIRPATGFGEGGRISLAALYDEPRNIGFVGPLGGMIFGYERANAFSCHFLFIPRTSGSGVKSAARAMINEMFTSYGACVIRGYPPRDNRAVRVIGTALGFYKIPNGDHIDDFQRPCETYELRRQERG